MEYHWIFFSVVLQLTIDLGSSRPTITPSLPRLVVQLNAPFSLRCQGERAMRWQRDDGSKVRGEERSAGASVYRVNRAQPLHMGRYVCLEESSGDNSSIYIYVKEPDNPFRKSMIVNLIARRGDNASIPCLATDPTMASLGLEMCDGAPLPQGLRFSADLEKGVVIYRVEKAFEHCYVCTGRLDGAPVKSHDYHLIVRPVPDTRPVIELQAPRKVVLIQGQRLSLTCITTNVNGDIKLTWASPPGSGAIWASYPQQPTVDNASRISIKPVPTHTRSATLRVASVRLQDAGRYRCDAQNERGVSSESVWLNVHLKGFIHLEQLENSTIQVRAGESLSLRVDMEAYPRPHMITWSFKGQQLRNISDHVITTLNHTHSRYNSELKLVRIKVSEGGVYTFSASNGDATTNQTFTVYVISKPEIVSHEGPVDGQVRCVAEGFPAPQITWYYCEQPYMRCSHQLNATEEQQDVVTFTVSSKFFGMTGVESRLNVSRGRFSTLECVATAEGEQAYTLFSISERTVPHELFTPLLIGFVSAAAILCLILIVLFYKYLQKPKYQIQWKVIEGIHGNNYVYIDPTQLPYDNEWEFPRDKLRFGKTLGSGAFGKVVEATAYGLSKADTVMTVAVKMLKPSAHATEKEALMSELKVLSYLGNHMNIVNLLGACTVGGPTLVITEYCCFGDLLNFLRRQRESFFCSKLGEDCYYRNVLLRRETAGSVDSSRNGYMTMRPSVAGGPPAGFPSEKRRSLRKGGGSCSEVEGVCDMVQEDGLALDTEDLLSFSYQVAKGMDFLASKNCIHRDLAARNILLTQGRVAKICDFGLARDITTDSNYVVKGNARLPVKWMSPESIFECVYTFESDVWSYGILLWEIFSLGNSPYPGMPVDSKFYKMIKEGCRMDAPEFAPTEMYQIMRSCWDADPFQRPPFRKVVERIEQQLSDTTKHIYLNFSSRFPVPAGTGTGTGTVARDDQLTQNAAFQRLNSVGSSNASNQPLLVSDEVYLEGMGRGAQRV